MRLEENRRDTEQGDRQVGAYRRMNCNVRRRQRTHKKLRISIIVATNEKFFAISQAIQINEIEKDEKNQYSLVC